LRSNEDLAKTAMTIHDLFPAIRNYLKDKDQILPISFRTIRDLAEKLVMTRDPITGKPIFEATNKTFGEALYEVLVESYESYENPTVPLEIAKLGLNMGLFVDDRIKDKLIKLGISETDYEEKKKVVEEHKEDFSDLAEKIRGMVKSVSDMQMPTQRNF